MPVESQAQRRFMYATEEGKTDAPPSVGKEFIDASHGLTGLPDHVDTPESRRQRLAQTLRKP